jgi:hypothetical protein
MIESKQILLVVTLVWATYTDLASEALGHAGVEEPAAAATIRDIVLSADSLTVRYSPPRHFENRALTRAEVAIHWEVEATIKCPNNCEISAPKLTKILEAAKRSNVRCYEAEYVSSIAFFAANSELGTFYLHAGGTCMQWGDRGYLFEGRRIFEMFERNSVFDW